MIAAAPAHHARPDIEDPRLVSERNPHGSSHVAALLARLAATPRGADDAEPEPCRNGCGRPCAERAVSAEAWARRGPGSGGRRPRYCGPECERAAHNRRRKMARCGGTT